MTILYLLSDGGKHIAQWSELNRETPPARQIVLMPRYVLQRQEVRGYYRRTVVRSRTESASGYSVELEAVKMPSLEQL